MVIIRILLRLSDDYDQIQHSSLDVEGDIVTLGLEFFPWKVVEAVRRVEEARRKGFFRLGDLWRLERHGILDKTVVESAGFSANLLKQPRKGSSADTVALDL